MKNGLTSTKLISAICISVKERDFHMYISLNRKETRNFQNMACMCNHSITVSINSTAIQWLQLNRKGTNKYSNFGIEFLPLFDLPVFYPLMLQVQLSYAKWETSKNYNISIIRT